MTLLSIKNLSVTFPSTQGVVEAVDNVSFDIGPGETLGLVGESGCGKSVTAMSILRLIESPGQVDPASSITFDNKNLLTIDDETLRQVRGAEIGMVFQEPTTSLNPVLTVGFQIAETILAHEKVTKREAKDRAADLLKQVGIPDPVRRLGAYPHELSGGMQQRVMIAIALACSPRLIIADEPTTALDVTVQAQILDLLAQLRETMSLAMLFITHDLGVVARVADRVAVMYGGRIVERGPTNDIFASPSHPYTEGLLNAVPHLDQRSDRLAGIPGAVPNATSWPTGCRFHPRCPKVLSNCSSAKPPESTIAPAHSANCWLLEKESQ
jgi:peptide/nickel transport system ATP-binding protein